MVVSNIAEIFILYTFQVNDATMTDCDILSVNGVIHVINKVLLPEQHVDG
jgi:uncharacterized surface protein with fasciclin (FAS1) repeats